MNAEVLVSVIGAAATLGAAVIGLWTSRQREAGPAAAPVGDQGGHQPAAATPRRWKRSGITWTVAAVAAIVAVTVAVVVLFASRADLSEVGRRHQAVFVSDELRSFAHGWLNDVNECVKAKPPSWDPATELVECTGGLWTVRFYAYRNSLDRTERRDWQVTQVGNTVVSQEAGLTRGDYTGTVMQFTHEYARRALAGDLLGSRPATGQRRTVRDEHGARRADAHLGSTRRVARGSSQQPVA